MTQLLKYTRLYCFHCSNYKVKEIKKLSLSKLIKISVFLIIGQYFYIHSYFSPYTQTFTQIEILKILTVIPHQIRSDQSLSRVRLFVTP